MFLDCEFTGLTRDASLISLALYVDEATFFYAEFNDYDRSKINDWVEENVMRKLEFNHTNTFIQKNDKVTRIKENSGSIVPELKQWLSQFDKIEIWGDVPHYDWVLFCDLFGGALNNRHTFKKHSSVRE